MLNCFYYFVQRFKAENAKQIPLFRTLMWGWFAAAMFYSYGSIFLDYYELQISRYVLEQVSKYHSFISFVLLITVFVLTVLNLKKDLYKYQIGQWSWTVTVVAITVIQVKFLASNILVGLFWFLVPASLVICNDVQAYMCGLFLKGKCTSRPLISLSPNKTWFEI